MRLTMFIYGLLLCLLLCGCSRPERKDGVTDLVYWTGWTGHELEVQKKLVARFNRQHPKIRVKILSVGGSYQKVRIAIAGGSTPDVCSAIWADELAGYAMRGALTPLDDYIARSGRKAEEYMPGVWRMFRYNGHTWALNATTNSNFVAFNKDIFREVGLDPEKPPQTVAELDRAAELCTRYDDKGGFVRYGFRPGWLMWWAYVFGGKWYDPETRTVTANDPHNVAALEWIASYSQKYDLSRIESFEQTFGSQQSPNAAFFVGKVAMWTTGEWVQEHIIRYAPKLDWGYFAAPAPPGGRPKTCTVGGSVFVIPAACKHKDEAWEFLNWICGPEAVKEFCLGIGNIPPLKAVAMEPEFQKNPLFRFAIDLASSENAFGPPGMPVWPLYTQELTRAEDYAIHGRRNPKELLDEVARKMQRELDRALKEAKY
ncbi:MAG: ABC transporter substrate-binding protein [Armatimonadetes bacterium]|nr:ABC transporter substrate-binding protein [Armatimonadota bacterium]